MSLTVFLWVLAAAMLHAGWNALVKNGGDKRAGMMLVALSNGLTGLGVVAFFPFPGAGVWPWILASGLVHTVYYLALGAAYAHGDLSRVYPIARGTAPLLVLAVGGALGLDRLGETQVAGVVILGMGILMMARGVFANGESARLVPYAFLSALATAGYSITDGLGARLMGSGVAFTGWALAATAVLYLPFVSALHGRVVFRVRPRELVVGLLAGGASYVAYTIVVRAMTQAPIALVAALRETSILFAVLIGWLLMHERMDRGKMLAGLMIALGAVLTRL